MPQIRILRLALALGALWLAPILTIAEEIDNTQPEGRKYYLRVIGGYGTDEILVHILRGKLWIDKEKTAVAGFQVGTPLVERMWDTPLDLVANAAVVRHLENGLQHDFNEYAVALKLYWSGFAWRDSVDTRLSYAMGLSYAEHIPYMERDSLEAKQSNVSRLLMHLDLGLDFNLGDIFDSRALDKCYFGPSVWHRSGVFGDISLFDHANGGYNWLSLHLECVRQF